MLPNPLLLEESVAFWQIENKSIENSVDSVGRDEFSGGAVVIEIFGRFSFMQSTLFGISHKLASLL